MHYVRRLVRPTSQQTLKAIESAGPTKGSSISGFATPATLLDASGRREAVRLLHPAELTRAVGSLPVDAALDALRGAQLLVALPDAMSSSGAGDSVTATSPGTVGVDFAAELTLYVRETVADASREIASRQERFLAKLEGKLIAGDFDRVSAFVKGLLTKHGAAEPFSEADLAVYRGVVEELCTHDAESALAVAINSRLPPLNAAAGSALARLVDLSSPAAVTAFLDAFAPRDSPLPAHETCATQLAIRLRHQAERQPPTDGPAAPSSALLQQCLISRNTDPGSVHPTNARAVQDWAALMVCSEVDESLSSLHEKRTALVTHIRDRMLLPRRTIMDALSTWCLSDLERSWVEFSLGRPAAGPEAVPAAGPPSYALAEAHRHQALALILKDPRRNLVANRQLREYAALLEKGFLSPEDSSVPAFLDECGECHDVARASGRVGAASACPPVICFTMRSPPPGVTVLAALEALAPFCSLWTTLLSPAMAHKAVSTRVAPEGEVLVEVCLPAEHECLAAAREAAVQSPASAVIPVLYEDEQILVVDKPSGLATSRHALSCTQLGEQVTDLVSVLLQRDGETVESGLAGVFRQGQVHRLDRETSGCLVFAKTNVAADSLRHQMGTAGSHNHDGKLYLALCVVLEPELNRLLLRGQLRDPADAKVQTHYRIVKFFRKSRIALVECRIQQGKKHQVRRHLAGAGLPILGDVEHGGACCTSPLIDRVALHARSLSIVHPTTAEVLSLSAPLPADFHRALTTLWER